MVGLVEETCRPTPQEAVTFHIFVETFSLLLFCLEMKVTNGCTEFEFDATNLFH